MQGRLAILRARVCIPAARSSATPDDPREATRNAAVNNWVRELVSRDRLQSDKAERSGGAVMDAQQLTAVYTASDRDKGDRARNLNLMRKSGMPEKYSCCVS